MLGWRFQRVGIFEEEKHFFTNSHRLSLPPALEKKHKFLENVNRVLTEM